MAISFDNAFGIHPTALSFRADRTEVLSANLANADTPGYKAKDIQFSDVLSTVSAENMTTTQTQHFGVQDGYETPETLFRNPQQASVDGNTVEPHIEQTKFAENALQYQASLRFVNGKISSLMTAIKGE